jgi:hypothetical protein
VIDLLISNDNFGARVELIRVSLGWRNRGMVDIYGASLRIVG